MLVFVLSATILVLASSMDLKEIEKELEENFDIDFLKNYFKFHLYVNPHPICAMEDEQCTLDNNCCRGLECKMAADREGVRYTCQTKVEIVNNQTTSSEATDENDVRWTIGGEGGSRSEESTNSFLQEIYRSRLKKVNDEEERLLNDQFAIIKELQKPLTMEEMRELQQAKELEDYKREKELKELRKWAKDRDLEEEMNAKRKKMLQDIAKERVTKVLKEEERQKLEMFRKIQEAMKQDMQGQQKQPKL